MNLKHSRGSAVLTLKGSSNKFYPASREINSLHFELNPLATHH